MAVAKGCQRSSKNSTSTAYESGCVLVIPPATSNTDMKLMDHLGDKRSKISLSRRPLAGPVNQTEKLERRSRENKGIEAKKQIRNAKSADLRLRKSEGKMNCLKKKEKTVEIVLTEEEKDLWENSSWRSQVKDLNESFSKLPPIFEGNKCGRKGQAFVVTLEQI